MAEGTLPPTANSRELSLAAVCLGGCLLRVSWHLFWFKMLLLILYLRSLLLCVMVELREFLAILTNFVGFYRFLMCVSVIIIPIGI